MAKAEKGKKSTEKWLIFSIALLLTISTSGCLEEFAESFSVRTDDGGYILISDPYSYVSHKKITPEKMRMVLMVPLNEPETDPLMYARSNFSKIPNGLKKGDIVIKSEKGLRKVETLEE